MIFFFLSKIRKEFYNEIMIESQDQKVTLLRLKIRLQIIYSCILSHSIQHVFIMDQNQKVRKMRHSPDLNRTAPFFQFTFSRNISSICLKNFFQFKFVRYCKKEIKLNWIFERKLWKKTKKLLKEVFWKFFYT